MAVEPAERTADIQCVAVSFRAASLKSVTGFMAPAQRILTRLLTRWLSNLLGGRTRMKRVQKARVGGILMTALIAVCVIVFGRKPLDTVGQPKVTDAESAPLVLRRPIALSVGDQTGESADSSSDAVPIQWDAPRMALPDPVFIEQVPLRATVAASRAARLAAPRKKLPPELGTRPAARFHRIVDGETLRDISARYFGTPDRYMELFQANRGVLPHPDVLPLGARIRVPTAEEAGIERLPSWDK